MKFVKNLVHVTMEDSFLMWVLTIAQYLRVQYTFFENVLITAIEVLKNVGVVV